MTDTQFFQFEGGLVRSYRGAKEVIVPVSWKIGAKIHGITKMLANPEASSEFDQISDFI